MTFSGYIGSSSATVVLVAVVLFLVETDLFVDLVVCCDFEAADVVSVSDVLGGVLASVSDMMSVTDGFCVVSVVVSEADFSDALEQPIMDMNSVKAIRKLKCFRTKSPLY